jgi:hypothetical protein
MNFALEKAIANEAFEAARIAEAEFRAKFGEPFYCGFAWVNVRPGTSKMAKYLKTKDHAHKSYEGGVDVWNPGGSNTQSMDIKEVGASAFAKVLRDHGYKAYAKSRAD